MNGGKMKNCSKFKSSEKASANAYTKLQAVNCKECVYFSTRNCGMDAHQTRDDLQLYY